VRENDSQGFVAPELLIPAQAAPTVVVPGGSARVLAGLVSYGRIGDAFDLDDVEGVLGSLSSRLLASRTPSAQWALLLSSDTFAAALLPEATDSLRRQKSLYALVWFDERTIVQDNAAAFGRRVEAEALRREELAVATLAQRGVSLDEALVQRYRRRLLRTIVWEKSMRALPALFVLVAAVLAVTMLLRLLKLPA